MIYICEKWVFRHRKYRVYFELRLIDGKKCEDGGPTAIGLPFSIPIYMGKPSGPALRLLRGEGYPPPAPTSFSCLDTRKGGKRRSRLRSPKLKDELRTLKSEKLASLRSASDTRISGRVLATRLSGRLGTDAVPPDAQWSTDGLTDKKWASPYAFGSRFLSVRVGAYCIRPIRRPRQGDEGGYPVISQGDLLGLSGPYCA